MNKMERTNHGRGMALTMGLASMHACVLLEFVERLYDVIDGFNVLTKDYVLKWVVFNVCILLEIVERLDAEINGFNVCILLEFIERLYPGIDDFNVCVLLELSDSLCVGFCYSMCDVCSCQNVRGATNLQFVAETESSAAN